jgi:hypothetical protein
MQMDNLGSSFQKREKSRESTRHTGFPTWRWYMQAETGRQYVYMYDNVSYVEKRDKNRKPNYAMYEA